MTPGAIPFQKPARFALANRIRTTNPLVGIRLVEQGKFRVAPKLTRYSTDRARQAAENLAQYTGDIDVARKHAAEMLRRFRETRWGRLSDMRNATSLSRLNAHLDRALEFGRGSDDYTKEKTRADYKMRRRTYANTGVLAGLGVGALGGGIAGRRFVGNPMIGAALGGSAGMLAGLAVGSRIDKAKPDRINPEYVRIMRKAGMY